MNILTPTADGSNTLFNEEIGEHYHSAHGALQEAKHVFIWAGLEHGLATINPQSISIIEVGFGTGLNFLLTLDYCLKNQIELNYTGVEAFPLTIEVIKSTGYDKFVSTETWEIFINYYEKALDNKTAVSSICKLKIAHTKLDDFKTEETFDIVYFDAFSVRHQPEMWTSEMIAHTCNFLKPKGIFVTYAITGNLKRAIKSCGFDIEKLPGAPGKREMLRGIKI